MTTLEAAFKDSSIVGAYWTLGLPEDMNPAESTFTIGNYSEAVFDPDNRTPVDETDYQDGGKYRCKFCTIFQVSLTALRLTYDSCRQAYHEIRGTGQG